jgi:DNA-binding transcriptional ArsR family regulator
LYFYWYIYSILEKSKDRKRRDKMPKEKFDSIYIPAMPWSWIQKIQAPKGGATFRVALYIWFQKGVKGTSRNLVISSSGLNQVFKIDKRTVSRALHDLESLGMITVERQAGKSPRVTILY